MVESVDGAPSERGEEDFCGEEYDNLYFLIMDLMHDGLTFTDILDVCQGRWSEQIQHLKEHGYLGGQ